MSKAGARPSHVCCCCNLLPLSQSCLSTATGRSRVRGSRLHCTSASSFTPQSPVAAPSPTPPANVTHPPMATDAKPDQPRASTPTEVVVYRPQATGRVPQATGRVHAGTAPQSCQSRRCLHLPRTARQQSNAPSLTTHPAQLMCPAVLTRTHLHCGVASPNGLCWATSTVHRTVNPTPYTLNPKP